MNRIDAIQQAIERDRNALRAKSQREAELEAAASIQQGLMAVRIPQLSFADVTGRNLPCAAIGGDFFSVVAVGERIVVSIADVCGKGIAAAVMASLLQRMIHEGLRSGVPLAEIGRSANDFFCQRDLGVRYATFVIVCVQPDGAVEDLNCAHVPPVLVSVGRGIAYRTAVFASAEEFLAADDRPEVAVCLVLDVRMPGLSGLDLQRCLTDKESTIPIIFVTAHADEELRVRALQQGAVAFLGSRLATKLCSTPSNQLLNYLQTSSQWGGRSGPALPSPRTVQACHGGADASVCAGPLRLRRTPGPALRSPSFVRRPPYGVVNVQVHNGACVAKALVTRVWHFERCGIPQSIFCWTSLAVSGSWLSESWTRLFFLYGLGMTCSSWR